MTKPAPYQEIAQYLRDRILGSEQDPDHLHPGDELPSENDLAERFDVVRSTATRAIALLRSEGLIATNQGARSTVRGRPRLFYLATGENFRKRQGTGKPNDIAEAEAQGYESKNDLLSVGSVPAPRDIATRLDVDPGTPILARVQLHRARRKDADPDAAQFEPMKIMRCYYEHGFADGTPLAEASPVAGGIANLIEAEDGPFRRTIARFVEDIELRMPLPDEVDLLLIPPGVPVARILRTMYDATGAPVEVLDSVLPGDRYNLRYIITVPEKP